MNKKVKLEKDIEEYCQLNNIQDIEEFKFQCLMNGFNGIKYGFVPSMKTSIKEEETSEVKKENKRKPKIKIIND